MYMAGEVASTQTHLIIFLQGTYCLLLHDCFLCVRVGPLIYWSQGESVIIVGLLTCRRWGESIPASLEGRKVPKRHSHPTHVVWPVTELGTCMLRMVIIVVFNKSSQQRGTIWN
jgi:hypothetical protein